ncbi:methyl-accepting chemotaxis protein [Rhizobium paknamense]|uniref:Methyl-accepting chemotaxis protein n=1 Tax=Rhizobium paknamense TaxID=1206817 RepID=A0ABU0IEW0_9HYPH|nr:HAMP domain-containing methyl-accepting chemotaxis protein [Rhizobium paknamense]MDQ0456232.1 methyl-accepting chemotaxis protein [Rhizobium paknamense]
MRLTISSTVTATGIALALGVMLTLGTGLETLSRLKVNGPIYQQIVDSKDLIADILPPPLYVVETYSLVNEAVLHPDMREANLQRINLLKGQYQERRDYWKGTTLPDSLKQKLQNDVLVKGDQFWSELQTNTVPALSGNDDGRLQATLATLKQRFHTHEAAVNELVDLGNTYGKERETAAAEEAALLDAVSFTLGGGLLILCLSSIVFLRRRALKPLREITAVMGEMAAGNLNTPPMHTARQDEIGDMARALAVFREAGLEKIRLEGETEEARTLSEAQRAAREAQRLQEAEALRFVLEELGAGLNRLADCNIRITLDKPFDPRFESLRQDFNNAIGTFQKTLENVLNETRQLTEQGAEMREAADNLSRRTEQQASSLEETAAALEEVASTVKASAGRARDTRQLVKDAIQSAAASSGVVTNTIAAMQRIETASSEIGTIIGVIDEIAFQTNLLALNAGVEAARAGEAGKGFAVVAQEVRELAQRSAKAAREIRTLIDRSGTEVASGVDLVEATGTALTQIQEYVARIETNIDVIATATDEQALGLQEISSAVNALDQMTQQNAAMVEETNAISQTIANGAMTLSGLVERFQLNRRATIREPGAAGGGAQHRRRQAA